MSWSANPFIKSLKQILRYSRLANKGTVKFIGQDNLGNKYYEAYRPNHTRQTSRYFSPDKVESFSDVLDATHVPPAWDSWLRFRRKDPPTLEEVSEEQEYFKMQQAMAAQKREAQDELKPESELFEPKKAKIPPGTYDR